MKIRRKTNRCLNCFRNIDQIYNFCPNCGQENTNRNVSFKDLIREFFNNYLSFDSKFGRSIKPFFFNPGKLTNEFISGRRVNYANPIRLYLILSLFYFFALNQFNTYKNKDEGSGNISINSGAKANIVLDSIAEKTEQLLDTIPGISNESVKALINKGSLTKFIKYKNDSTITVDQLLDSISTDEMSDIERLVLKKIIIAERNQKDNTEFFNNQAQMIADSIIKNPVEFIDAIPEETGEQIWPFRSGKNLAKFIKHKSDMTISDSQLFDSLNTEGMSKFDQLAVKQVIRIGRAKNKEMLGYIIEQMPLLMFIMLPIFALVMKLLYVRRKQNYIIHLVHSLHQHSFKFLILGLATTIGIFTSLETALLLIKAAFVISLIYILLSFKNVYKQKFFKTFFKFGIYYFIYFILLTFGLVFEMLISLAFY